jgi:choline dehydrogenase-like flavoprotein
MGAHDIIIIGTGAGGGTLARYLAPSGKRILLIERGDWLPREPQNWSAGDVFVDNRYVSEDTWFDERDRPFQPQVHYFVGGATKLYGAALYRLRVEDFGELRHRDGISPAWPIGYDEMEPYYTLAERMYEVHGARGEDPTEPPASSPTTSPPPGTNRSTPPAASCSTRPTCRTARAYAARRVTASRASCTRSPMPRCWACALRSSTATSR